DCLKFGWKCNPRNDKCCSGLKCGSNHNWCKLHI
uniref:Mu-theraphotoxin-Tp1a n=1 Tax=Thrixopelma pruriens TaxID=213387 RepID=HPR3_THRPR|nr:RecName: Full=Mu-theraphotoxin-Tp1a; Short=Mu-TRTX-Tp1a; AltName: Full=Protoxin III; Short=ProTx-III [Thrixopelma pruriens]